MAQFDDEIPKRVIWMQDEVSLKWVLVGLDDDDEEFQDHEDYRQVPRDDHQSVSRVWMRDEDGKWNHAAADVSPQELARANATAWQASSEDDGAGTLGSRPPSRPPPRPRQGGTSSPSALPSNGQKYSARGHSTTDVARDAISEEGEPQDYDRHGDRQGERYHDVKPSDTFQFICLKYRVSADALRTANGITGSSLRQGPKRLTIPSNVPKATIDKDSARGEGGSYPKRRSESTLETESSASPDDFVGGPNVVREGPGQLAGEDAQHHWVEPDDSLRWICLKYKVNANDLRKANNFTGSNLKLAPKKLVIPRTKPSSGPKRNPRLRRPRSDGGALVSSHSVTAFSDSASCPSMRAMAMGGGHDDDSMASSFFSVDSVTGMGEGFDNHSSSLSSSTRRGVNVAAPPGLDYGAYESGSYAGKVEYAPPPMDEIHFSGSDSDDTDGAEGGGGVRYHDVRPSDTVERLCMKYRVSAPALRRANIGLTGRNLQTGPKRLIVPPRAAGGEQPGYARRDTPDSLWDAETVTTNEDETNTLALSDGHSVGHSTLADQMSVLDILDERGESGEGREGRGAADAPLHHDVQSEDTLQGICGRYGVSAHALRRANGFRGLDLRAAPDRLVIPPAGGGGSGRGAGRSRDHPGAASSEEEKIRSLRLHAPTPGRGRPRLSREEARAYLEFNDWNFDQALRNVRADVEYSSQNPRFHAQRRYGNR